MFTKGGVQEGSNLPTTTAQRSAAMAKPKKDVDVVLTKYVCSHDMSGASFVPATEEKKSKFRIRSFVAWLGIWDGTGASR